MNQHRRDQARRAREEAVNGIPRVAEQVQQVEAQPETYSSIELLVEVGGSTKSFTYKRARYTLNMLPGGHHGQMVVFETEGEKRIGVFQLNRLIQVELSPAAIAVVNPSPIIQP